MRDGTCEELLAAARLLDVACCGSCHSDFDEGYSSELLVEYEGRDYAVCCAVSGAVNALSLNPTLPKYRVTTEAKP